MPASHGRELFNHAPHRVAGYGQLLQGDRVAGVVLYRGPIYDGSLAGGFVAVL